MIETALSARLLAPRHDVLLGLIAALALPGSGWAQTGPAAERGWIGAAIAWAGQTEGQRDCPYLCGPLGGSGVGASASAGIQGARGVAVVVEALAGTRLEGPQQVRVPGGFLDLSTQHRDAVFSGGASLPLTPSDLRLSMRAVALAGIARRRTVRTGVNRQFTTSSSAAHEDVLTDVVPAAGGGLDFRARLGRHIAVVPSFRIHYLFDDDTPDNQPPRRGVGSVLLAGAVGVSVLF